MVTAQELSYYQGAVQYHAKRSQCFLQQHRFQRNKTAKSLFYGNMKILQLFGFRDNTGETWKSFACTYLNRSDKILSLKNTSFLFNQPHHLIQIIL